MRTEALLTLASVLSSASAHSIFVQLTSGGTTNPVGYGIADPSYDGPINDVTTNYIACNGGPNPTTPSPHVIDVQAGSTVQATWRHTLTSTAANDDVYVIDPSHLGPVQAYMKKVTDATTDPGYGGGWFKVSEEGYNVATKTWAVTNLIANKGVQQIPIPACIAPGQYLIRAEVLALHAAGSSLGAQFYQECAQVNVIGGTGASTPSTVSFPGAYGQSDPGILINIYSSITSYAIPGPTPFSCGGSQAPTTAKGSTSTKATSTTAKATTLSTSTKTTTSSGSTGTGVAAIYAQCGGTGWTGATVCASGSTCTVSSAYYSQCLPS